MIVEELATGADEEYEEFLKSCRGALFFHSPRYRRLVCALVGGSPQYPVARNGGRVCGALPLIYRETEKGRVYNSLPWFGSHGDIVAVDPEARQALAASYAEIARARETRCATLIRNPFASGEEMAVPSDFEGHRISHVTELPDEPDPDRLILAAIHGSARRNVRKAEAAGVRVREAPEEMATLAGLHRENMAAIGGPAKSDEFFALVPELFRVGEDYRVYVAEQEGVVTAALMLFYFKDTVEYFVPAIHPDHRSDQPLSAILVHALAAAARLGYRLWNWGGTMPSQTGLYRFKRKWATREATYRYETAVNDDTLLNCAAEELLESYPGFYVVPFSELKEAR